MNAGDRKDDIQRTRLDGHHCGGQQQHLQHPAEERSRDSLFSGRTDYSSDVMRGITYRTGAFGAIGTVFCKQCEKLRAILSFLTEPFHSNFAFARSIWHILCSKLVCEVFAKFPILRSECEIWETITGTNSLRWRNLSVPMKRHELIVLSNPSSMPEPCMCDITS